MTQLKIVYTVSGMGKKLISLRFDEALLERLDQYALMAGSTRTGILEEMALALAEGRLVAFPPSFHSHPLLPVKPRPGCSPLFPALIFNPEDQDA